MPHRDFDPTNLRVLYTSSLLQYQTPNIDQLGQLLDAGMNTIVASVWTATDVTTLISKIRGDATLKQYKYILGIHGPVYDAYIACQKDPSLCNASTPLPQNVRDFLDHATTGVIGNHDLFVGYYTFDEPTRADPVPGQLRYPVDVWYQRKVYQYIRGRDPDAAQRPVAVSNTLCETDLTDTIIGQRAAIDVQDVLFIDQYSLNYGEQVVCFQRWRDHNLLAKPTVLILKAFTERDIPCSGGNVWANAVAVESALETVFPQERPERHGWGYFAHWPYATRDFGVGIDDCAPIFSDVARHVRTTLDHLGGTLAWLRTDIDGDGRLDVMQLYDNAGRLGGTVYRPQNGRYVDSGSGGRAQMGAGSPALAWLTGDVNGDGRVDLMQAWNNAGRMGLIVYGSDGVGYPLTWGMSDVGQGSPARAWLTGDVDADKRTDIIQPWDNDGRLGLIVHRSDGVGYSVAWSTNDAGEGSAGLAWLTGDVDGDRRTDIIQPWDNAGRLGLIVYRSDGVGYPRTWGTSDVGEGSPALAWLTGDVDGDGRTDIIQPWNNAGRVGLIVYRSNGTGYYSSWGKPVMGPGAGALAWLSGDTNGDRLTDLVQVWDDSGVARFITYLSNGTGFAVISPP